MKIVVIVGIVALILVDVFLCYQVLRAEARGEIGGALGGSPVVGRKEHGQRKDGEENI